MQDFMKGIAILANEGTVITIENPSFALLLRDAFLIPFITNTIHI